MKPKHIDWLTEEKTIITEEGKSVKILKLSIEDDKDILNSWAKHFREHYCRESEIDQLRKGYKLSREEYLKQIKFPSKTERPGPSTRSGDFTEILIADYVQYVMDYFVPRTRYDRKINKNSSPMGTDIIGYKCHHIVSSSDELIIFEVKAAASETIPKGSQLQKAINDSNKDIVKLAESLNAIHQRLIDRNDYDEARNVQRFQNSTDSPYLKIYAAAAVHSDTTYSEEEIKRITTATHFDSNITLIVVHCNKLMSFIHDMYGRAAKC